MLMIRKKSLILGEGPTQELDGATLTTEKLFNKWKINSENNKKFCLSLHYNGGNSYLLVNGIEIIEFNAKDSEIVATPFCIGNVSKDVSIDNMKKTGLNRCVYAFSVANDAIAVDDLIIVHKYLMKKNGII